MASDKFVVNVEAAVFNKSDDSWLMIRRSEDEEHAGGMLSFVGGTVDHEDASLDTLEHTAAREAKEEVDIDINVVGYVESHTFLSDTGIMVLDVVMLASMKEDQQPKAVDPSEVAEIMWMTTEEVCADPASPAWIIDSIRKAHAARENLI